MNLEEIFVLLPCNSLEDLSLDRRPEEADQLLSAWSALYHPAIVASAERVPSWSRASSPPVEPAGRLFVIPPCCAAEVPDDWREKAESAGGVVIDQFENRQQLLDTVLDRLELRTVEVDPALAQDFLALGFCHLIVELLTRQLRYMSNLDEVAFQREVTVAAEAAVQRDEAKARERLRSAFDLLTEAREYFYPVEAYLLDLTLVAPTTVGPSLRSEIAGREFTNLLVSGQVIDAMAEREPATLETVKQGLQKASLGLVGGEFDEQELPLLTAEAILTQLRRGLEAYQRHLGVRPAIFGRRRFGLSPILPQILRKLGFTGALHLTLDDGRFPKGNQSKIRWEGLGGAVIDALARLPQDASRSDTFFRLSEKLGDVLDLDHAATVVFAHWPGSASQWYGDLHRAAAYAPVLGKFASIHSYFRDTEYVGKATTYPADQYRSPYLRQAVAAREPDALSRWVRYHRRRVMIDSLRALDAMASLIDPRSHRDPDWDAVLCQAEESPPGPAAPGMELDRRLSSALDAAAARLARALPREKAEAEPGYLIVNPWSFSRRLCADVSELSRLPATDGPVRLADRSGMSKHAVVEVPAMGFAWVGSGPAVTAPRPSPRPRLAFLRRKKQAEAERPMAEENFLRNEFFQVKIDPATGAVQSIRDYAAGENRLSQQIAYRFPPSSYGTEEGWIGDADEEYSVMAADEISVISPGPIVGETKIRGRLLDRRGSQLAGFTETLRLRRGSRVLDLSIDLDIDHEPADDPWQSYYAVRFAWNDETADLYRSLGSLSVRTESPQIEAPYFIDIRPAKTSTTILTGGLPYHRRVGLRMLDTLLAVRGETARSFRLGIGVDLAYPWPAALELIVPEMIRAEKSPPPIARSGWLFHVDSRNIVATCWEPMIQEGGVTGFRARLMETEGRKCTAGLRSFRPIKAARKVDLRGELLEPLKVEGDRIEIPFAAQEWVQLEAEFLAAGGA